MTAPAGRARCIVQGCTRFAEGLSLQCPECQAREREKTPERPARARHVRSEAKDLEWMVTEAERQEEIRQALLAAGYSVYRVGQRNARGTQDGGVADLIVLKPGRGVVFVECKRPVGGEQSEDQATFQMQCELAGVPYICASRMEHIAGLLQPRGKA